MFDSPFGSDINKSRNQVSFEEADIIFVADLFSDEYVGGAELTTEALFKTTPFKTYKLKAQDVTEQLIFQGAQKLWVFFNFSHLNFQLFPTIVANCHYFIVEYDYKFCKYRSVELHKEKEGSPCDCHESQHGKMISAIFSGAEKIFWMSKNQMSRYQDRFPFIENEKCIILSSVFDVGDLEFIERLRSSRVENSLKPEYIIINSNSWIKGVDDTVAYLEDSQIPYELVNGLSYHNMLRKLSEHSGMAFMPLGGDTCPRAVIEARLLGLDLILNSNVQHATEDWWQLSIDEIETYLLDGHNRFWNIITGFLERKITLSGYTTTKNVISSDYPWRESIESLLGFCDEVVVVDGGSTDGTWEALREWSGTLDEGKLRVYQAKRDWDDKRFALFDGQQKAIARTLCKSEWCWQQDVDEVIHEDDYEKITKLLTQLPKSSDLISLPIIEYWGGSEKIRIDVNPWKWRLSKNNPQITHDVPTKQRAYDSSGNLFSLGSDGCDYVYVGNYDVVPDVSFYTPQLHQVRVAVMQDSNNIDAFNAYQNYMRQVYNQLPSVRHYSWFDIKRKIYTYKNYWSKHWASIYNKTVEDVAENNMFFDKPWSEVSDEEIVQLSDKMKNEMGGWIFHTRINFDTPTKWITLDNSHPSIMSAWLKRRG
jgi:glycosyltransferase involved in cell wall biosynthesis